MLIKNYYNYTCNYLAKTRILYNLQTCYKQHLYFIKYQAFPSLAMSNRLVFKGNYLKSFKLFHQYYMFFLRANFCKYTPIKLKSYIFLNSDVYYYLQVFNQFNAIKNISRMLLWRGLQLNSLFKLHLLVYKKKKKVYYTNYIQFINENKRILLIWNWLKFFLRSLIKKKTKRFSNLHFGMNNFITATPDNHVITDIKLQTYRVYLLRNL